MAERTTAQNSHPAGERRLPVGRRFVKGQSGNPGGRPKGFVRSIREQTRDGEELVAFMLRIFRGELPDAKLKDRIEVAAWLADRGFGKPVQAMEHTGKDGESLIPVSVIQAVVADAAGQN